MRKYSWKYNISGNAQKVGEELEEIEKEIEISNESVLKFAKENKNSELHKCFEWDDNIASEKYRLIQANQIISSISFIIEEEPVKKQKMYYSIKSSDDEAKKFKNIKDILEDDEEYKALINKAKKEFDRCKDNYEDLIRKEDLKEIVFEIYKEI